VSSGAEELAEREAFARTFRGGRHGETFFDN